MMMNLREYAQKSVLCWLATTDADATPNVSPKEMFTFVDDELMLIANIASPQSEQNIFSNAKVCVSFIDIFEQRGFKVQGIARVVKAQDSCWEGYLTHLRQMADERYPIQSIFEIRVESVAKVQAPSYFLFADTTPESQVESALKTYQVER
ncbi:MULTISPECIES: pyridoxamine 5'-phosphate oxidase family protein [Vibrio]|nr:MULTISPECIES: pyridoxamine 5'-phosphate oxidase family protein [Vibrio]